MVDSCEEKLWGGKLSGSHVCNGIWVVWDAGSYRMASAAEIAAETSFTPIPLPDYKPQRSRRKKK